MKIIIVGLGNPGSKFDGTRHNAGFMAVDFFAAQNQFPDFAPQKKSKSLISELDNILLVKPQTFMNESGNAVKKLSSYKVESLVVVHDDIDIPLGRFKISKDSSAGGHKGVESVISALGTKDFARIKIGIATGDEKAEDVVLKKFSPAEQEILNGVLQKVSEALNYFISEGLEKTVNKFN